MDDATKRSQCHHRSARNHRHAVWMAFSNGLRARIGGSLSLPTEHHADSCKWTSFPIGEAAASDEEAGRLGLIRTGKKKNTTRNSVLPPRSVATLAQYVSVDFVDARKRLSATMGDGFLSRQFISEFCVAQDGFALRRSISGRVCFCRIWFRSVFFFSFCFYLYLLLFGFFFYIETVFCMFVIIFVSLCFMFCCLFFYVFVVFFFFLFCMVVVVFLFVCFALRVHFFMWS